MSACDQRAYYPARTGLFKLRASDGDLVWECRPIIIGSDASMSIINRCYHKHGSRLVVSGVSDNRLPAAMFLTDDGEGVTDVVSTIAAAPPVLANSVAGPITITSSADTDGTYAYVSTLRRQPSGFGSYYLHIAKFDIATGEEVASVQSGPWANPGLSGTTGVLEATIRCSGTSFVDVNGLYGTRRFPSDLSSISAVNTGRPCWDNSNRIISDGSYYYAGDRTTGRSVMKIDAGTLATSLLSADSGQYPRMGDVRGGILAYNTEGVFGVVRTVVARRASDLTVLWTHNSPFSTAAYGVGCCANFVVSTGVASASQTPLLVVRRDLSGTIEWQVEIDELSPAALFTDAQPRVLISSDESKVYVWGPFLRNGLAMTLFCLSATDGSIQWSFAAPAGGISLIEDGDYVYLGAVSGTAPLYR